MAIHVDPMFIDELLDTGDFAQIGMEGLRRMATTQVGEFVEVMGIQVYVNERIKRRANMGMSFLSFEEPTKEAIGNESMQTLRATKEGSDQPARGASPLHEVSHKTPVTA